ncbi:uncharacterized protein TNCV_980731 [Trichonephila clavipes]|uniref:Uncharacterized protein n=1 Tax=Trichonephila clavipes TaxID=2585209 RepID=A0A8X6VCP5_TRICX|nr:uncharacterized protein TNCV_980731 [Trichonephila clavipes]
MQITGLLSEMFSILSLRWTVYLKTEIPKTKHYELDICYTLRYLDLYVGYVKIFLCLDNEHIFGGDQGYTPEIMDEILTTARDLELEVNEDDIEELLMGHEDELTTEKLLEILNEEHQETQRNVSPSEQEEEERGLVPTSVLKYLLKKWEDVRARVLEWYPYQADISRLGDLYNNNAINYFRKILKKIEKQLTTDMFFTTL